MITMAARSSKIASASRNAFSDTGTRSPNARSSAKAKAMSVAAGMAQPSIAPEFPQFSAA